MQASEINTSYTQRLKQPPEKGGARHAMMEALLDSHRVGIKLPAQQDFPADGPPVMEQNYISIRYNGLFSPCVFIHGRELFKDEAAYIEFSEKLRDQTLTYKDLPGLLSVKAVQRIERTLLPESFNSRVRAMCLPQTRQDYGKVMVAAYKQLFPSAEFTDVPEPAEDNLELVIQKLVIAIETAPQHTPGAQSVSQMMEPQQGALDALKAHFKQHADLLFNGVVEQIVGDHAEDRARASALKDKLWLYLEAHEFDPQIFENYATGIHCTGPEVDDIEELIQRGVRRQAYNKIIGTHEAQHFANPFSERFQNMEQETAKTLAQTLHWRVIRQAIRDNAAFVVGDAPNIMDFKDVFAPIMLDAYGKCERLRPMGDTVFNDIIAMSSKGLNMNRIGVFLRHEAAHFMDFSAAESFETYYKKNNKGEIEKDRKHVEEWQAFLRDVTPESPIEDIEKFFKLANKLQLEEIQIQPPTEASIMTVRDILIDYVGHLNNRLHNRMFSPQPGSDTHLSYSSELGQLNEIPPVVQELRAMFGPGFTRAMLPNLYPMVLTQQAQHSGLRDDYPAAGRQDR